MTSAKIISYLADPTNYCEMITVNPGTFIRGEGAEQHTVTITEPFKIGKYLVTQGLWYAVTGKRPSYFKGVRRPVEQVSWDDAQEFIKKLKDATGMEYALPTEAQWEYAARGGADNHQHDFVYAGSNDFNTVGWNINNSDPETTNVGLNPPNTLGIHDMLGNIWEWCEDEYDSDYYKKCTADTTLCTNPTVKGTGSLRVIRGGSWHAYAQYSTVATRNNTRRDYRNNFYGLRLVLLPLS
jgi:formylglycine-generating enzyme required for sulfatase activity